MAKEKPYRIHCPALDLILSIKNLDGSKLKEIYTKLRKKFNVALDGKSVKVDSYIRFICELFVDDWAKVKLKLSTDEEKRRYEFQQIYEGITGLPIFLPFKVEILCADINQELFAFRWEEAVKELSKEVNKVDKTENFKLSKINKLDNFLRARIFGQDDAITNLVNTYKLVESGLYKRISMFFIGSTGSGKTLSAKLFGEKFSGNFWKINCAEYSQSHEVSKLIGAPAGYVGHQEVPILREKAEQSKKWVILFDEVEKAHPRFHELLLSLLDDGTIADNKGAPLDFSESIFIFTSNEGYSEATQRKISTFSNKTISVFANIEDEINQSVRKKFSPEFINRIDKFIFFQPLSEDTIRKIIDSKLKDFPVKRSKALIDYVLKVAYSEEYGGRSIDRWLKTQLAPKLADAMLLVKDKEIAEYEVSVNSSKTDITIYPIENEASLSASGN